MFRLFFLAKYKIANRTFQISFDNDMIMIDAITGVGGIMVSIVDPGSIPADASSFLLYYESILTILQVQWYSQR